MAIEAWRAIAERFGLKYGVEVYIGGSRAYSTADAIYLPGDVPEKMQDVVHGLFLHVKEHILQKDHEQLNQQSLAMRMAMGLMQDIHNDEVVLQSDPGYEELNRRVHEYMEKKFPMDARWKGLHWKQKTAIELHNRSLPRSVWAGESFGADRQVKHFFKVYRGDIKKMYRELKDLRTNKPAIEKWARWVLDKLFDNVPTDEEIMEEIKKFMGAGLIPPGMERDSFECVSPGDLKQKVPEAVTVQKLKEFLTETFEEVKRDDSGTIDPAKLPTYWNGEDDLYVNDARKVVKKIEVKFVIDSSSSMDTSLSDGVKRYNAVMRGVGLVAQACERITRDEGMEITMEAWAFADKNRLLKRPEDRWDPGKFKKNYMSDFGGGTSIERLIKTLASANVETTTRQVIVVLTDGEFFDNGNTEIENAMSTKNQKWLLIGIGDDCPADGPFRFVAKSLDEVEYILTQVVKEATLQL